MNHHHFCCCYVARNMFRKFICRMPIRHFVSTSVRNIVIRYPKHSLLQFSKFSTEGANTENQQEAPQPSEIDKLKEENQKLAAEIKDLKDKILRVYADEENVRRIAKKDVENAKNYANTKFAKSMLDIADNLERALSNVNNELKTSGESPAVRNLLTGLEMTYNELDKVFKSQGLVKFGAIGEQFNPDLHDALFRITDPSREAGKIGQLLKAGYKLNDRVIRAAEVGTICHPEN